MGNDLAEVGDVGHAHVHGIDDNGRPATSRTYSAQRLAVTGGPTTLQLVPPAGTRSRRPSYNRLLFVELCRSADVAIAVLVLGASFLIANAGRVPRQWGEFLLLRLNFGKVAELSVFALLWQQIFHTLGLYRKDRMPALTEEAPRVILACTIGAFVSAGFALLSRSGAYHGALSLFAWPPIVLGTLGTRYVARKLTETGSHHQAKRVLVVGSGPLAHRMYRDLTERRVAGDHELVGFVDSNPDVRFSEIRSRLIGTLEQLESLLMQVVVDEVLVALPIKSHYAEIQRVIEECERAGVQCRYSHDVFHTAIASPRLETADHLPVVAMHVSPDDGRLIVKRAMDITGATIAILLSAPIWLLIAAAIKATSPGPVFFAQERYGWRKRRFRMLKFRTMVTNAEALQGSLEERNEAVGPVFKIKNDPRITSVGRLLRRTSLDELPQFVNVLRGDMSLVGPRPLPPRDVGRFSEARLMRRFSVTPGITGLWQVSGRSDLEFDRWIALDLEYIDRWSLGLDIRILLRTIPAVLHGTGAS